MLPRTNSIGGATHPRSCVTCRKRKVKCDKRNPCSNCTKAKIECVFPSPGRAPRKSRKPPDGELMERLRKLEGVVQSLNAQVEEEQQAHGGSGEGASRQGSTAEGDSKPHCPMGAESPRVVVDNSVEGLENRFGRLVVDQGRSRYINNSFWASLNNEVCCAVEDLKSILLDPSEQEEDALDSPDTSTSTADHQSFLFGYSSSNVNMLDLHPSPERLGTYWNLFKENVDPLVKVLHVPTIEPVILEAATHLDKIPKGLEALLFVIYYGAVTSQMPKECLEIFGEERSVLLKKYRFAVEQSLARANFLYCDEIIILQAFVLFLMLLRRNDDARIIWTLTGLVVRIAQTLGVHRDGSHFNLPPFEVEMRRRLWWEVCILDARASEDHGCDPTIVEAQFDTQMPLNVNDADLDPNMKDFPESRIGFTEMTFCIIRFEVANIFRRILYIPPGPNRCNTYFANLTIPEKEKWITECHQRLEEKYLSSCDMTIPLYWVTATISRLVMSKMWLVVYHPHQRKDGGASLPQETKDKLFITSLENIEYAALLETEARTMKWGWLFRTYVQWHAIAFLLSELCVRTKGEAVERAWRALEKSASRWWFPLASNPERKGRQGCLWKPLRKLMAKARAARERELALERAAANLRTQTLPFADLTQLPTPVSISVGTSHQQLDAMLRPTAPRLGDNPVARQPTSLPATSPLIRSPVNVEAQKFQDLSSMGFDWLMTDVMGDNMIGEPLAGDYSDTTGLPTLGNGNPSVFDTSPNESSNHSSNSPFRSPVMDDGSVDWANWDDMVREYGMEVDPKAVIPGQTISTGANLMGLPTWF
ncbi:uncharacterized protein BDZ99DRAFT_402906 [Mytilinidion resinicola]|uniref:Zn(2)-C6 fungal-type domain-containing protein n=1 Tax=Mytilinidion resinicola TaxID=574789 RepID=A0A6A6XZK6_9PEZI|nr:uncharacterized protein BDZ99DRAFT_402906 [Mytilinidion resinicola]KAF2801693.1 hypothetical protein BDZ99DRAFT_402906 [Mytilinidion resinicola]